MAITLVQLKPTDGTCSHSTLTTVSTTFDNAVTEGNLIVMVGSTWANLASYYPDPTITDNKGNTWQIDVSSLLLSASYKQKVIIASTIVAVGKGGANFIVSGSQTNGKGWDMAIFELSGTAITLWVDGTKGKTATSTAPSITSSPSVGPRLYFAGITYTGTQTTITPDDIVNWTQTNEDESSAYPILNVCIQAGNGDKTCSWTLGASRTWCTGVAAYKDVDCGGGMIIWDGGVVQGNLTFA